MGAEAHGIAQGGSDVDDYQAHCLPLRVAGTRHADLPVGEAFRTRRGLLERRERSVDEGSRGAQPICRAWRGRLSG
jgi:hypothetical protein